MVSIEDKHNGTSRMPSPTTSGFCTSRLRAGIRFAAYSIRRCGATFPERRRWGCARCVVIGAALSVNLWLTAPSLRRRSGLRAEV